MTGRAKHRRCKTCKGTGRSSFGVCFPCQGAGTLTPLCSSCGGHGGREDWRQKGRPWLSCTLCLGTGRASARGQLALVGQLERGAVDALQLAGVDVWEPVAHGELPGSSLPGKPNTDRSKASAAAPGAGAPTPECDKGGGAACLRSSRGPCESCVLTAWSNFSIEIQPGSNGAPGRAAAPLAVLTPPQARGLRLQAGKPLRWAP